MPILNGCHDFNEENNTAAPPTKTNPEVRILQGRDSSPLRGSQRAGRTRPTYLLRSAGREAGDGEARQ